LTTKIAIASTLKPVIDPRAYEKIGCSLAQNQLYEVHILGSPPTLSKPPENIALHTIANSKGSLNRVIMPWKILVALHKIKPQLLIIGTHELLFIGAIYKLISGCKLIYDIRENYYFNLRYQKNYPFIGRQILAFYVRTKEIIFARIIDHFFLAEQCYVDEIKFTKQRFTILENKYNPSEFAIKKSKNVEVDFILSGTISKEYGVFDALQFFSQFTAPKIRLTIIGHCPNKHTFRALTKAIKGIDNLTFKVSTSPISHQEILSYINDKSIGLLPYQPNNSTKNKLPTKLYEYIGMGIPVLISNNPLWNKLLLKYSAGMSIDFKSPISIEDISRSLTIKYNTQNIDLKNLMWNNEEPKLLALVKRLLS
jgi:glycosyltransferase involved in cell wall biosynthesis